jgi:elongation factor Ts
MEITSQKVKELREKTGAGMMDCKNALTEAGGDEEKAIEILRKRGLSRVEKRAGREAKEGLVQSYLRADGKMGVLVEVKCETDFVAKTDDFLKLVTLITDKVATATVVPTDKEAVLSLTADSKSLREVFTDTASKLGENLIFNRFCRMEIPAGKEGMIDAYIHTGSKLGVLLMLETGSAATAANPEFRTMARDIALHIAASSPLTISRTEIEADVVAKEKEIFLAQLETEGKKRPPEVMEKIITGKLEKFYSEVSLLEQISVKHPDKTIGNLLTEIANKTGDSITLCNFCRFKIGE